MFSIDLSGRLAWVTGGSRGIGKATALALADAGANVAITYRTREKEAHEVASEIVKRGVKSIAVQMDSRSLQSCDQAHGQISDKLGVVDILVNNTGIIKDDLFTMLDDGAWQDVIATNVLGTVHATRLVIKDMMLKRQGRIINISSAAASKGGRGQANYAASKGAIESMSRSLAVELGRRGITVNCIAPGVIETDMSREIRSLAQQEILQRQIIQRFGQPNDVAAWVVFIASDFGAYITGEVIHIDGGLKLV
jgi:3-oxoacyl-[acyl-carrier protein] reductase